MRLFSDAQQSVVRQKEHGVDPCVCAVSERGDHVMGNWLRSVIVVALVTMVSTAAAQQSGKVSTVGVLMLASGPHDTVVEAFRRGMRDLGYVDGRNVRIEHRSALGKIELLPQLAEELVATHGHGAGATARAARDATSTVPIVVAFHDYDPVAARLIDRSYRPR